MIKEQYDLIVNIDLVCSENQSNCYIIICTQDEWLLSKEVVADLKEVFMLFDKDEEPCFSKYHIKLKRLVSTLETQFKCFEGSNFWSIQKSTSVP